MAEAIVLTVVGRLTDLLAEEAHLLNEVRDEIEQVVTELKLLQTFLRDADSRINEERVRTGVSQVRELVYDAEDVVETFLLKASSHETNGGLKNKVRRGLCGVDEFVYHHRFSKEIKHVQTGLQNLSSWFRSLNVVSTLDQGRESSSSSDTAPCKLKRFYSYAVVEPDLFVGFENDVVSLVGHLVNERDDCYPVIFICGMGGLGKTTLATKIYNHVSVKRHFEGMAWVTILQKWQPKAVLQRILISLNPKKIEEILEMEVEKLVESLLQVQQRKNCLIVLDDIWTTDVWDSIKAAFPTESCRSKLLLTSRNVDVAACVNSKCFLHEPRLLTAEQSWELLRLKALPKSDHLDTKDLKEMEKWGREMVQNCAGLPLAIVVFGGVLVTKPTFIEKVYYDSLSSLKRGAGLEENYQRQVLDILVWSYNALPTQLKLCFLYLGKFKEDEDIEVETLYQLWIAEGMVLSSDKSRGETMMEVAESYMGELVHKSMVQVKFGEDAGSQGKFKSCRLHDLMRDLSLSIAKEEDFFKTINLQKLNDNPFDPSLELTLTRQVVVYSDAEMHKSIKDNPIHVNIANKRRLRSLSYVHESFTRTTSRELGWNVANFRLLRVFSMEGVVFDIKAVSCCLVHINPGSALDNLVHLRYLSLTTDFEVFPCIQNLKLLQTLKLQADIFTDHLNSPAWMSTNILAKLKRLQHLYLPWAFYAGLPREKLRFEGLSKLETLEGFNTSWCEVKDLIKLTNLRKLTVHVRDSHEDVQEILTYLKAIATNSSSTSGSTTSCPPYVSLHIDKCRLQWQSGRDILRQLLRNQLNLCALSINGAIPELLSLFEQKPQQQDLHDHIDCLSSSLISTMTLSRSRLNHDPMPVLEKLPMLRILKLKIASFVGKKMKCSATGFPQLTHLELCQLDELEKWEVEEGSIPNLSYLLIHQSRRLQELPEGLKFLKHLQKVHLQYMSKDLSDRVRVVNGDQGLDFYKVAHVPSLVVDVDV
ncbi:putative disease resistance protein At1g50180 [Apium graveolens]|uniref:putative disease resistance protein At1g50180 n=1 Tax=Apium graveolens TaxID=4045 RepID=UPI003D7AE4BA